MKESLTVASYQDPNLKSFCDSLTREQYKIIHRWIINNADTSGKALLSQQKEKSRPPKKQNFRNKKANNKSPKPSQSSPSLKNDKWSMPKWKNTKRHSNFCGKGNHDESKCFKKMESLEAVMKKHHISLDLSSESNSHGHALCASGYSYIASSSSTSIEWFIDFGASYHMTKDQAIFSTMHECNTKQIFVGDDRSLSVVGSGTIP